MNRITFLLLFVLSTVYVDAQSYVGFLTDNYSGVNSVIYNPANITDSNFKADINLFGISAFAGNDYYGVNIMDALKDDYDFDLDAKKSPRLDNNATLNLDVMGPAFMFNLNNESSIAVFTRARSMFNVDEINGETIDKLDNDNIGTININEGDFNMFTQAWAEVGITYARVLYNNEQHFIKGGLTLKYLQGAGSGYVYGRGVEVNYIEGIDPIPSSFTSKGQIAYGRFDEFDNDNYDFELPNASGFGADLGFIYEWRTNDTDRESSSKNNNKYKLKLGLSITDIGSINYKEGKEDIYDITGSANEDDFDNADDFEDFLNSYYSLIASNSSYKTNLPTALHLNADWSFTNTIYLNLNTDFSLISKGKENASRISNIVSLTPRYESKWFSFYVPMSVVENNGFQAGAGFRLGPLYIGSGSVLTTLASDNSKGADVYAGLKIPIY